jgi:hypothetical protein
MGPKQKTMIHENANETDITLGEILEAAKTNPWWQEVIDEVDRMWMLRRASVPLLQKVEVVHALFESSCIETQKLRIASADSVFQEARSIIRSLSPGEKYPERIYELFKAQKGRALEELDRLANAVISFVAASEHREQLETVWTHREEEVPEPEPLLAKLQLNNWNQRYLVRSFCDLAEKDYFIRHCQSPFATDQYFPLQIGEEKTERYEYLAYRVFDPLWNLDHKRFEKEFVSFPLKWSGILPSTTMDRLYEHHKKGNDVIASLCPHYEQQEHLERIRRAISTCPITRSYGCLFNEIVESYGRGLFKVSSFCLLALVEGLLWAYAWWWNIFHGPIFDRNTTEGQYRDRKFQLISKTGKAVEADIGRLLRQTEFGDHLYYEAIEYFCQELFGERNPVLHGREPGYGDRRKVASLLFVVENIERQITGAFKEAFAHQIMAAIDKGESEKMAPRPTVE